MEMDRILRYEASKRLPRTDNLRRAHIWISRNSEGFATRVQEFDNALETLGESLRKPRSRVNKNLYGNVLALREQTGDFDTPPTLSEAIDMYTPEPRKIDFDEFFSGSADETYRSVAEKINSTEWEFPHSITDNPNQLASALLIEGYGLFIENLYEHPGLARNFVLALEEVLFNTQPNARLLKDVIGWMKEEQEDFSPSVARKLKKLTIEEAPNPLEEIADYINVKFRNGASAYQVLDQIRKFPRPIAVDFNNVLANNTSPLQVNPDAPQFIRDLREIGNVFIVTNATGWKEIQGFLTKNGLWHPGMVLMTNPTYSFITQHEEDNPHGIRLREEFLTTAVRNGWADSAKDLIAPPGYKRIAPIFRKPWLVPIIDDSGFVAGIHNPGMLGIQVKSWEPELNDKKWHNQDNENKLTLQQAVEIARNHYSNT